jgi:hypothetical protein
MPRFQFNLRQLLLAMVAVAVALLLVRFAIRSQGVAVALLVVAIGAAFLLVANAVIYAVLRGFGMVFDLEPDLAEESRSTKARPAESESNSESKSHQVDLGHQDHFH